MIVATLATYPPRRDSLVRIATEITPQVDTLNIVLNEYDEIPKELAKFPNINPIIPTEDTKDAGKFYPEASGTYTFMCDDDLLYPADYIAKTVERFEAIDNPKVLAGYHASTYRLPRPRPNLKSLRKFFAFRRNNIPNYRAVDAFYFLRENYKIVDQVASGCCVMRSENMPPYSYMRDSQKFVDVRLGKWCFEQDIMPVCLPRSKDWITPIRYDETIFQDFTRKNPTHVSDEIWTFAFKVKNRGQAPKLRARS